MSAPTLTQKQMQQTVRKKKSRQVEKTVLSNPYIVQWPTVQDNVQEDILQRLLSTLKSLDIARPKSCKKRKKKKTKDTKKDTKKVTALPLDEERRGIRKQLLFGVNQVTRGLEKDEVRLVITCRSAQPVIITRHLIGLATLRDCPAICISDLNKSVCKVMNMTSAVAVGFKKTSGSEDPSVFDDLVEFVAKHTPEITLPWLPRDSIDMSTMETPLEEMDTDAEVTGQHADNEVESSDQGVKTERLDLSFNEQDIKEMSKGGDRDIGVRPHIKGGDRDIGVRPHIKGGDIGVRPHIKGGDIGVRPHIKGGDRDIGVRPHIKGGDIGVRPHIKGGASDRDIGVRPHIKGGASDRDIGVRPHIKGGASDRDIGVRPHIKHNVKSHVTQADQTKVDYSHFYVYKSEATKTIKKWPEFLKFSSDPEESVDYRNTNQNQESVEYEKVSVKRMPANPNRKKRKRNFEK